MHVFGISASDVCGYGISDNKFRRYIYMKKAMSKGDELASPRRIIHGGA